MQRSGSPDWKTTAASLSPADRRTVRRANAAGVAVPAERADLAGPAVQRARAGLALMDRLLIARMARVYRLIAGLSVLFLLLNLALLLTGSNNATTWINLVLWSLLTAIYAFTPRWQRRQVERLHASIEANTALTERS